MNILIVSFLKIKMKGLVFVNEVGIYLSLDLRMVYVSQLYIVKMFLNEFLGYEIQYVFNVTGNYCSTNTVRVSAILTCITFLKPAFSKAVFHARTASFIRGIHSTGQQVSM